MEYRGSDIILNKPDELKEISDEEFLQLIVNHKKNLLDKSEMVLKGSITLGVDLNIPEVMLYMKTKNSNFNSLLVCTPGIEDTNENFQFINSFESLKEKLKNSFTENSDKDYISVLMAYDAHMSNFIFYRKANSSPQDPKFDFVYMDPHGSHIHYDDSGCYRKTNGEDSICIIIDDNDSPDFISNTLLSNLKKIPGCENLTVSEFKEKNLYKNFSIAKSGIAICAIISATFQSEVAKRNTINTIKDQKKDILLNIVYNVEELAKNSRIKQSYPVVTLFEGETDHRYSYQSSGTKTSGSYNQIYSESSNKIFETLPNIPNLDDNDHYFLQK